MKNQMKNPSAEYTTSTGVLDMLVEQGPDAILELFRIMMNETMKDAQAGISEYMNFFNEKRIHQHLAYKTPDQVYFDNHEERMLA
ncbi:MAG TPA: IS3 family transposase [Fibrobacteraceae bacterium]|nr:IS3 family transposase [Fibrobacteraceae bacterium]